MKYLIALILMSQNVAAADQWFCTDESGKRDGNTIMACGVAEWTDEGTARKKALEAAIEEFETICEISSDCKHNKFNIEPKRTTCIKDQEHKGLMKCYRLIVVTLVN